MKSDYEIHADALADLMASMLSDCPQLFWSGQLVRAMPGGATSSSANSPGGFSLSADCRLVALVSDFKDSIVPDSTQTLNYPGETGDAYKVLTKTISAGGKLVSLTLEHIAQSL
jgi:hypothetical protein